MLARVGATGVRPGEPPVCENASGTQVRSVAVTGFIDDLIQD
jgi:hypothetical protein